MRTLYVPASLLLALISATNGALAQEKKTVYVDRMEGLEPHVERALREAELPFDFVEEKDKPNLKAELSRLHSGYGEIHYRHKLGRHENYTLELVDVDSGKAIARHRFHLPQSGGEDARVRAAREFAEKVKKAYRKPGR